MYDFYFGTREQIASDEGKYLVSVKRMMPRWLNSLPDSEFLALAALLDGQGKAAVEAGRSFVAAETGAGASTLAFAFYAMKYDGMAYSYDINGEKGSNIRTVLNETICGYFGKRTEENWRFMAFDSTSPLLGLPVVKDLAGHLDLTFHDSEHTWNTLRAELEAVTPLMADNGVVMLDDANLDWVHTNLGYVNTFRKKQGLPVVEELADNRCEPFYRMTENFLRDRFETVTPLDDDYKKYCHTDPYFAYYDAEFDIKAALGTERSDSLEHRFDSFRVSGRKETV